MIRGKTSSVSSLLEYPFFCEGTRKVVSKRLFQSCDRNTAMKLEDLWVSMRVSIVRFDLYAQTAELVIINGSLILIIRHKEKIDHWSHNNTISH